METNTKDGLITITADKINRHLKLKKHSKKVQKLEATLARGNAQGRFDVRIGGIGVEGP